MTTVGSDIWRPCQDQTTLNVGEGATWTTEITGTRSGKLFSVISDERGLASRLAVAEEALATARVSLAERDQVVQELTSRLKWDAKTCRPESDSCKVKWKQLGFTVSWTN